MADYSAHIRLASPEDILAWSSGEVYAARLFKSRSHKPEPGGLFCETIFGPPREWGCVCRRITDIKYRDQHCTQCRSLVQLRSGRRTRMGHIELAAPVIHPWMFRHSPNHLARLLGLSAKRVKSLIYGTEDNETGALAIEHLLKALDLPKLVDELRSQLRNERSKSGREEILTRLGVVEWFRQSGNSPQWLVLSRIPVLPMGLRPFVSVQRRDSDVSGSRIVQKVSQAFSTTDLNELYRRVLVINANLRKLMQNDAPSGVLAIERVKLQRAVDALFDNAASEHPTSDGHGRPLQSLADRLNGKHGRFRSNLLGKRVDYSGRAVIIVGPELELHQCGLPWRMAVELFEPFLVKQLLDRRIARDLAHATRQFLPELIRPDYVLRTARMLFRELIAPPEDENATEIRNRLREIGDETQIARVQKLLIEEGEDAVFDWLLDHFEARHQEFRQIVESTIRSHPILLNRAPTLHRLGIQAFEPVLTDGNAIRLHPVVCKAFAADFDGDQMAVHVPLSFEAQIEARVLLMAPNNLFNPASGKPIAVPTQDVVLGCAYMTADPYTTPPRPFDDVDQVWRAVEMQQLRWHDRIIVDVSFQSERLTTTAGRLLFHAALPGGLPFRDETVTSAILIQRIVEAHEMGGSALAMRTIVAIQRIGLHAVTRSGATFSLSDLPDIAIDVAPFERLRETYQRGLMTVESYDDQLMKLWFDLRPSMEESLQAGLSQSTLDGPNPLGVMVASKARGSIDQMRQLGVMRGPVSRMSQRGTAQMVLSSYRKGLTPFEYFASASGGRKALADRGLSTSDAGDLTRRLVFAAQRAVIVIEDCGTPHGITLPTLRTTGRTALIDVLTNNKLLVRAGKIIWRTVAMEITEAKIEDVAVRSPLTCSVPHGAICRRCYGVDLATGKLVEPGMAVGIIAAQSIGEPGTQFTMRTFHAGGVASDKNIVHDLKRVRSLFEGNSDEAKQLLETEGLLSAQRKLVEQLATIYREQQLDIDDRHLEVVVRQMGRLVEVIDPGGTSLVPGQRLERDAFNAINAKAEHKASCCQRLCGLKRIVQESEGFLAAAGFQDTVNILFEAALAGKRDSFMGLKEHVMVGGLIPAGTGPKCEQYRCYAVGVLRF